MVRPPTAVVGDAIGCRRDTKKPLRPIRGVRASEGDGGGERIARINDLPITMRLSEQPTPIGLARSA
jgi:hypothetical protein